MNTESVTAIFSPANNFTLNSSYCEVSANTAHLYVDVTYTGNETSSICVGSISNYKPFRQSAGIILSRFEGFTYLTFGGEIYLYGNSPITSAMSYALDFIYLLD